MQTTIATLDRCTLVPRNSFAHAALIALDFEEIHAEPDFALLRAPADFEIAQERTERLPC